MGTSALAPLLFAAALWGWPSPDARDRLPEFDPGAGEPDRGGVVKLPGWAWFVAAAPLLLAGPHVALAAVIVARTAMSLVSQARRRAGAEEGTASARGRRRARRRPAGRGHAGVGVDRGGG
ncbi:hypothetical protein WU86_11400 [Corynebacterium xerosis]|nr:hypothetical protein WU86_11400 [Corynebacterium xerosis]